MYSPWLHKWIDRLTNIKWLLAPQRIVIACFIIALIGVGFEYGPDLPGCGGPLLPTPTPTVPPPATATVAPTTPSTSTPRPTLVPTPLSTPVSPLPTATPPQSPVPGAGE